MKAAKIWIENNPRTGDIKPFEVFFHAEGGKVEKAASCKTKEGAEKAVEKMVKRNRDFYEITVGA